jgi:hypothetical protein
LLVFLAYAPVVFASGAAGPVDSALTAGALLKLVLQAIGLMVAVLYYAATQALIFRGLKPRDLSGHRRKLLSFTAFAVFTQPRPYSDIRISRHLHPVLAGLRGAEAAEMIDRLLNRRAGETIDERWIADVLVVAMLLAFPAVAVGFFLLASAVLGGGTNWGAIVFVWAFAQIAAVMIVRRATILARLSHQRDRAPERNNNTQE